MATLLISKKPSNEYSFIVNGNTSDEILNLRNDLTFVGNRCHFKTSNGANLIKEQNVSYSDVTLVASGTFTFVSVYALFAKLREVGFFDWIDGVGTIGGVTKFSELDDTFAYFGKAGKAVVVSNDELRLETITIHNYRNFVDLEDTFDVIVPNKMLVTDSTGTGIILRDIPQTQVDNLPFNNKIKAKTGFSLVGQNLTINPLWEWVLQGIDYTNVEAQVKTFPLAATGLQRIDYVVPNTTNGFDVITGQESENAIAPQIPYDGVYVTYLLVSDASVADNGEPDLSGYATTQYVDSQDVFKVDKVTGKSLLSDTEITRLATLVNFNDTAIQNELDTKLNILDYNEHFKGVYLTESALNTALPTASVGDYAQVNIVGGTDVLNYNWDAEESIWVKNATQATPISNTDALPEGTSNLYFTVARFLSNLTFANIISALGFTPIASNATITGATHTKITYDSKGLVTAGTSLIATDVPTLNQNTTGTAATITGNIPESQVTNLVTDLSLKAAIASPTFTGVPAAPTAPAGTSTTQIATTEFVKEAMILPVTETGTSFSLTDSYNGKIVILTASCTVTIPNGLIAGFEFTIVTLAGVTVTVALGGSVVLFNNTGLTMAEKLSCTIKNRTATNNYITTGNL